uniref:DUF6598 domain-containing protein n=1 Tax=Aegilops tauschii subsp. strangulata TaxID=200361 RepID=A0A453DJ68_AEGTS
MHFTHYTPRQIPHHLATYGTTLQILSFKIANIDLDLKWPLLEWPLQVYGVVAARDNVDRRRNILFLRGRGNFQEITQEVSACRILLNILLSPHRLIRLSLLQLSMCNYDACRNPSCA